MLISMTMDDLTASTGNPRRDEIGRLEERIEQLAARIENCRKFMLAAKIAIALGAALLLMLMLTLGVIRSDPVVMTAAIAAVLGGIVVLGSNASTARSAEAEIAAAEAERVGCIESIALHTVDDRYTLH
jgi:hypothetical protein